MAGTPSPAPCPLPPEAWLVALAGLHDMGPARLTALLERHDPASAWEAVAHGRVEHDPHIASHMGTNAAAMAGAWRALAARVDVEERWAAHAGIEVLGFGRPGYPPVLQHDLEPPAVLFLLGDPALLDRRPRVAVVGTRKCSGAGFDTARRLGRELATSGVHVVSGLALGIDGAAHRGALDAGPEAAAPIGVVASGLDVVYPRQHRELWEQVAGRGVLLTESPLGLRPERWRFPARNRIIAALADALVVVESPGAGGSMTTVEYAEDRDVPVFAMPGPVGSAASVGTNQLLFDGRRMARDAGDVLSYLGLTQAEQEARAERPDPGPDGRAVLRALGWEAATLDTLLARTGLSLGPLSLVAAELEAQGWITRRGTWFERVGSR